MTEIQPSQPEQQNGKTSVAQVKEFLEVRGRLLDPELQHFFEEQIKHYDKLEADMDNMNVWKRRIPFLEVKKKSAFRSSEENIKYAFEVFGKFTDMFDNSESLPRVATEMAKWGAEEFLAPVLERKKGSTLGDKERVFEDRRSKWFMGLERMMRASEAWRMFLSVSGSINNQEPSTVRLVGSPEGKIEFVSKMYEFMDKTKELDFDEFAKTMDSYFVPEALRQDVRAERLVTAHDLIRKTDGQTMLDMVAGKAAREIDGKEEPPMFYEYMWMVVSGKTDRYTKAFSERLKVIGRREEKENPGSFTPQFWVGVANETDVKEGLAEKTGDLIRADLANLTVVGKEGELELAPWYERKLREIGADAFLDDKNEGAIWIAMEVDLSKVLGQDSAFSDYARKIGAVDKPLVSIAVPVSVSEARILAQEYSGSRHVNDIRNAIVDAYVNRLVGLAMWHGFGADERVYLTPAWAQAAFNAALPEGGVKSQGNLISEKSIKEKSLSSLLSGRVSGLIINVLGGKGTGIDADKKEAYYNTAGSMERASWYVLEVQRALGYIPGEGDVAPTINYGHSMGAQIAHRLNILLPETSRNKMQIICATPLSTKEKEINTFMHGKLKNVMGDVVIQSRHSYKKPVAAIGRGAARIGKATGLDQSIINDMIIPPDASEIGTDGRECRAMINVHGNIYETEDAYVARQRSNLEADKFAFAQYPIDDLLLTSAVAGNMTVLVGEYDEVLDSDVQITNYKAHPTVYSINYFNDSDWARNLANWGRLSGVPNEEGRALKGPHTQVLVGKFGHYLNTNGTGRIFLQEVLVNNIKRLLGGRKVTTV